MNKALEYFDDMVESNQLDYGDEKPKCDLIRKQLRAIKCLEAGAILSIKSNNIVFVNKIMDRYDTGLCLIGYKKPYKLEDYGKTWKEVNGNE